MISIAITVSTTVTSIIHATITTAISSDGDPGSEEGASVAVFPVGVMNA